MQKKRGSKDVQEAVRLKDVSYLNKSLATQKQAAQMFGLSIRSVNRIWASYKTGGAGAVESKKRGVRSGKKINGQQAAEVRRLIKDKMPDQLKLPFGLWTREAVQQLILDHYGITLSRWQVVRYLKSWGYTPQKPISKAFEQNPIRVKEWLDEEYPALKKWAIKENATIYFEDEVGMRSNHEAEKRYSPKGHTPVITRTGQRFSLNMVSAISNKGHVEFMILDGTFNGKVFLEFLMQLIKHKKQKIFLVVDGHTAHKTNEVKAYLDENFDQIELCFLPPYSPALNAQAYVN
ncbi:MAG: IS630 family transposase [Bacteroidetes bacterium]|nr:MAG: IS630 family transposase [Bacteroidota bacterium]